MLTQALGRLKMRILTATGAIHGMDETLPAGTGDFPDTVRLLENMPFFDQADGTTETLMQSRIEGRARLGFGLGEGLAKGKAAH
jgi:hypothetical protein